MPLVKRRISPASLSRRPSTWGVTEAGEEVSLQGEYDLTAVANVTLCGALQQLASLVVAAQGVSRGLEEELVKINTRAVSLSSRLCSLEHSVARHNPRTVTVPEGDLRSFSERREHFKSRDQASGQELFTEDSRPPEVVQLYRDATETPIHIMREIDQLRDDGIRSSRFFFCEPVLGDSLKKEKLRKLNLDIETRRPASFVALREWCSDDETLTEVSLAPVSPSAPATVVTRQQEPASHKLPSPEQRVLALSLKYPPELVPIDVSGSSFKRLEKFRQSLIHFEYHKGKRRRKRVKRRNTIADTRDARIALADIEASTSSGRGRSSPRSGSPSSRGGVSFTDRSFDTTETLDTTSNTTKTSSERENHLHVLGLEVSVPLPPRNVHTVSRHMAKESNTFRDHEVIRHADAGPSSLESRLVNGTRQAKGLTQNHIYETVKSSKRDNSADKSSTQKSRLPISTQSAAMNVAVKLRAGTRDDATHSSSGNWSASSSTRTSVESDHHRPIASPTSSLEQDSIQSESLQIRSSSPSSNQRTNSRTTDDLPSTSSHASDGTLTPTQDIQDIPFLDDDTSSAYSCDTEGYYTSFHIDSGLRSVSYEGNKLASESEYELFGKGSTGTTNSSASLGTVVMRNPEKKTPPKPPQRVSSLERKQENRESVITVIHVNGSTSSREDVAGDVPDKSGSQDGDSRSSRDGDSGRETSSSPTEPTSPRQPSLPSPELEFSESDLEIDRQEIFRVKTTINSSRIPSMCVITPPQSDDESVRSGSVPLSRDSSGSQLDNQGQQAPAQGTHGTLASQGSTSGVTAKLHSFHNTGAKCGGATGGGRSVVDDGSSEKKDALSKSSQLPHGYTPTLTVIPRSKDGDINAHLKGIMHTASVASPARPDPEQPVLIRPSLVKQAEREKRLSQESDEKQKAELQKQLSKEEQSKSHSEKSQTHSSDLVSYKELPPPATTASHPFSAVPSSVKQNVVITPTNSLERRKVNPSKPGARVTLNSDGKVVYSSDSLPRRKGHSSFEPGPYIKQVVNTTQPQASGGTSISQTMTVSHMKSSVSTAPSSILHTPLPPPPTTSSTTITAPQPHPMAHRPQQPLPTSATHFSPQPHTQTQTQTPVQASQSQSVTSKTLPSSQPQTVPSSQTLPHVKPHATPAVQTVPSTQSLPTPLQVLSTPQPQITTAAQSHATPPAQTVSSTASHTVLHTSTEQQQIKPGLYPMHPKGTSAPTVPLAVSMAPAPASLQSTSLTGQQSRPPQSLPHQRLQQTLQQPQSPSSQRQVAFASKIEDEQSYAEKHKLESVAGSSNSIYGTTQQQQHLKQQQQIFQARQEAQRAVQQQQLQLQQQQLQQQQLQQQQLQQQQLQQQQLQQQQLQQQQLQQQQLQQQQLQQQQLQQQQLQQQRQQQQLQQQHLQQQIYQTKEEAQRHLHQQQMLLQQQPIYQTQQEVFQARQQLHQQTAQAQPVITSAGVIMASQGAPMSPRSQRAGAYVHVQGQTAQVATPPPQSTQGTQSSAKLPQRPQSAHGYPPGGTTSRAPTPVQGPVTSSPRRGAQPSTMALTHPHLRTDSGTHFSSALSQAPCLDQDLDPSTDRVLLALAHARLASQKPVISTHSSMVSASEQVKYGKLSNDFAFKGSFRSDHFKVSNTEMARSFPSPFQRNNSYKLATAPLSEATNSLFHRGEGQTNISSMHYELPVINNSTIHGPRATIGNPSNTYRRLNFSLDSHKYAGQGLGRGKTPAQKRPISPFSPGQIVNPNTLRRRFYGAQVMVNPAVVNELKSPKAAGTSKENKVKDEVIKSETKSKFSPMSKFSLSAGTRPRVVGIVKKPPSPVTDTEIW